MIEEPQHETARTPESGAGLPGLATAAAAALVVFGLIRAGVLIYGGWLFYVVEQEIESSDPAADAGLASIAQALWLVVLLFLASLVATVLYLVWLHRARTAAERAPGCPPSWARGWSIESPRRVRRP